MTETATYSVVISGKIKPGFDPESVTDAFARLFKLPTEKAETLVGTEFVIKKEAELQVAKKYGDKLAAIGLEAILRRHGGIDALSLEPVINDDPEVADSAAAGSMVCPKCQLEQPGAEECSGCGVIIHKALQQQAATIPPVGQQAAAAEAIDEEPVAEASSELKLFIAPAIVSVLGALLWFLIAITLDFEFGFVAWLIGGAIGFAAIASGASGNATGIVCGALVLFSICGGKYLTISSFQSDLAEALSSSTEYEGVNLREVYEEQLADAADFMKLPGDEESLREYMVSHDYSDSSQADEVTQEEVDAFYEYSQPVLEEINAYRPGFKEWRQYLLTGQIESFSTYDLMVESLDWKDMLFLLLGIGTAYQLASRGRTSSA